jgi:hypothetical protein
LPVIKHFTQKSVEASEEVLFWKAKADIRLTRRLAEGARVLQINMLDHVIVGQSFDARAGYFSFKEAGLI